MAPTKLKTSVIVNPTILNGSNSNQTIGKSIKTISAKGQQITNKKHQRIKESKVRIFFFKTLLAKHLPN
jgi:hypothetical protein